MDRTRAHGPHLCITCTALEVSASLEFAPLVPQPSPANGESSGLFSSVQWEAESPDLRPALPQHIPGVHAAQAGPIVLEQIP